MQQPEVIFEKKNMHYRQLLLSQTQNAYQWANRLIDGIPLDQWDHIPDGIDSNVTWQAGHLLVSYYYHSIMVITGHQMDVLREIPLKEYGELFTKGTPANAVGKVSAAMLRQHLAIIEKKSMGIIKILSSEQLRAPLEPVMPQHPIAQSKLEAIDWNIKHTMWHCGQLAMLKRSINGRLEFAI